MITLKSFKHYPKMSEETNAFSATILWKGKKVGDCKDNGRGGCIDFNVPYSILEEMMSYARTLPDVECEGTVLKMNLELHVGEMVGELIAAQEKDKAEKRTAKWIAKNKATFAAKGHSLLAVEVEGSTFCVPFLPSKTNEEQTLTAWKEKHPDKTVIKSFVA